MKSRNFADHSTRCSSGIELVSESPPFRQEIGAELVVILSSVPTVEVPLDNRRNNSGHQVKSGGVKERYLILNEPMPVNVGESDNDCRKSKHGKKSGHKPLIYDLNEKRNESDCSNDPKPQSSENNKFIQHDYLLTPAVREKSSLTERLL